MVVMKHEESFSHMKHHLKTSVTPTVHTDHLIKINRRKWLVRKGQHFHAFDIQQENTHSDKNAYLEYTVGFG